MSNLDNLAAVLIALTKANVPSDYLEVMVQGNPDMNIAPGALQKALAAQRGVAIDRARLCELAFPDGLDVSMLPRYGHLHAPRDEQQKLTIDAFALDVANYVLDKIMPHVGTHEQTRST